MGVSWMKTGAASAQMAEQEKAQQEAQKESQGKLFRFYLKDKEEAKITFVDGDLNEDGLLLPPRYYEHSIQLNGKWGNFFVCPDKTMPEAGHKCPICEAGDRPSLVALFTIIDHRSYKSEKTGKTYQHQKRLLVAKSQTMELLTKMAIKRGGLAGCTFDVSRMGEQSAAVGSIFDFVDKNPVEALMKEFQIEIEDPKTKQKFTETYFTPADYEQEIIFRTPEELLKLGVGNKPVGMGMNPGGAKPAGKAGYAANL